MSAERKTREEIINEPQEVTPERKLKLVNESQGQFPVEPVTEPVEEEPPVKNATQEEPRFKRTDHEPHLIDNQKNMDLESRSVSRREKNVFEGSLWIWIALVLALSAIPLLNFLVIPVLVLVGAAIFVVYGLVKSRNNRNNSNLK